MLKASIEFGDFPSCHVWFSTGRYFRPYSMNSPWLYSTIFPWETISFVLYGWIFMILPSYSHKIQPNSMNIPVTSPWMDHLSLQATESIGDGKPRKRWSVGRELASRRWTGRKSDATDTEMGIDSGCIKIVSHRIHGAGIYANIKGVYWWDPCYHI